MTAVADAVDASTLVGGEQRIRVLRSEVIRSGANDVGPWTLYRLEATLTNLPQTPIAGELRTFNSFDSAEYTVTITPHTLPGVFTVKKVRTAADVRASRSAAREKLVGSSSTPVGDAPSRSELDALAKRVGQLEARLEVLLSIVNNP